jgi:hypothetical protein
VAPSSFPSPLWPASDDRSPNRFNDVPDSLSIQFQARGAHDQAAAHREDGLDLYEIVLSQGLTTLDDIDNLVREGREAAKLDGAEQWDNFRLDPFAAVVALSDRGVLGSDL